MTKPDSSTKQTATIYYGGFLSQSGGAFLHASTLAHELRNMGWSVKVITLDSLPFWCRFVPHLGQRLFNAVYLPYGFLVKGVLTRALYKLHFSNPGDVHFFEDVYLAWNAETPTLTVMHAVWSDNLQAFRIGRNAVDKLKKYEATLINRLNHPIVTVSLPYLRYLQKEHFALFPLRDIGVVELGLDQAEFSLSGTSRRDKSMVFSGYLEPRKNVLFLLRVFQKVHESDPEYRLTVIGDGPERKNLTEFAESNNLPVSFLGKLSHDEVIRELYRHTLYLHTSVKESFSFSLLEAKIAGLQTCAFGDLQVPPEFIDLPVDSFRQADWCDAILYGRSNDSGFNPANFTSARMVTRTLALLQN